MIKSTNGSNEKTIHLPDDQINIVRGLLNRFIPDRKILVFGSRATGTRVKPYSDLDLCIMGDKPVDSLALSDLQDSLSESDLPIRVDLVVWADTDERFRKIIERDGLTFSSNNE